MSATSIGTEENSLGVPKAQCKALIYMGAAKQDHHNVATSTKRRVTAESVVVQKRRRSTRSLGGEGKHTRVSSPKVRYESYVVQ